MNRSLRAGQKVGFAAGFMSMAGAKEVRWAVYVTASIHAVTHYSKHLSKRTYRHQDGKNEESLLSLICEILIMKD